jgi:hypothetical protein
MTETDARVSAPEPSKSAGPVPAIWGDVPPRNKNFTGRDAIFSRLRDASSQVTAVVPEDPLPQALQGLGGVGKTAVATEYAHRYRADYEVVWWIPADQIPQVRASLAALGTKLGLEAATSAGIEGAAKVTLESLRKGEPYSRWLLIFDNADQPEDLKDFLPAGPGEVLITSRNQRWQAQVTTVSVDVFTRAESKEFLSKRAPVDAGDPEVYLLADKLGDLPLALDQAGAMLAETGMGIREYLDLLDEQFTKLMNENRSVDYPQSVVATWSIAIAKVRQTQPRAQELLRCCAFFGPDPIPRDVFRRGTQATETRISDLMTQPILLARAIGELGRYALVTISGRLIAVHRLVQAMLRDDLDEQEQARYRHEVQTILAAAAPTDPSDARQWPRFRELLPHVTAETTDLARSTDPAVRVFVLNMMRYLYFSGDFTSCEALTKGFIEQWTRDSGPDDPQVLHAQRYYADVIRELGRYGESFDRVADALNRARDALGEKDRITLAMQSALAANQRARGDFAAALDLDTKTLDLNEEAFGVTAPQTLRAIANVGLDYGLTGDYKQAREYSERAYIRMSEASSGVSPTEVLICWYNMAWAVRLEGLYSEARDVGEDAWDYGKERLGNDHFATLRAANGLSIALRRIAPLREQAAQIAEEVYEQSRARFGDDNPDTMAAAISLTNARRTNNRIDEAVKLAEDTVARYPRIYGKEHPYYYGCLGNLALLRRYAKPDEARRLNEEALAGLEAKLTRDHDYSLVVAMNLASDLAALGDLESARALGEGTLRRLRALLEEDHPLTLGCAANLVVDLRTSGADAEADELYADTMSRLNATLGDKHPDTENAAKGLRLDFDFDPPPL